MTEQCMITFEGLRIELQRNGTGLTGRAQQARRGQYRPLQSAPGSLPDDELPSGEVILGKPSKVVRSYRLGGPHLRQDKIRAPDA